MAGDYHILAGIQSSLGLGTTNERMREIISFAQRNDWMGRQIVDLGCGSGKSLEWMAQNGFVVRGVDRSPAMLALARETFAARGINARWIEQDIRDLDIPGDADMVMAIDVLNELDTPRDLEQVIKGAHALLKEGRLFVFDLCTLEGLIQNHLKGDHVLADDGDLFVVLNSYFDYERQIHDAHYHVFRRDEQQWERAFAHLIRRAYPVQAIAGLLQRSGFQVKHVLQDDLKPYDPAQTNVTRVIIMAEKR